ncbi:MAG: 3-deoxy-D-manno-octulosonic acid transferase, partial [Candidatus Omnitrophota bacterium]
IRKGLGLRFGIYPKDLVKKLREKKNIWVHAVSVGEVMAVAPLIEQLHKNFPSYRLVLTTVTETGNAVAEKVKGADDLVLFLPLDISFIIRKVLGLINPQLLIIAETEIWPSLISETNNSGVPIVVVNGRLSDNSFRNYSRVRAFLKTLLKRVRFFFVQTDIDKQRFMQLGVSEGSITVTGNMKFDMDIGPFSDDSKERLRSLLGLNTDDILLVCGSTHKGEDEILLSAFMNIKKRFSRIKLLIAPRHINRSAHIESIIQHAGCVPVKISEISSVVSRDKAANEVFVLDSIGELRLFYAISDIVFVGGSLVKKGGQNMIEAAAFSKPIIFGPYTFNFKAVVEIFIKARAAEMVSDKHGFEESVQKLCEDSSLRSLLGENAYSVYKSNKGATEYIVSCIRQIL